jgi:hypothetical protein
MPTHSIVKINLNPQICKIYTHNLSATEMTIEITGEDIIITSNRRGLVPNAVRELIDDPKVDKTTKNL